MRLRYIGKNVPNHAKNYVVTYYVAEVVNSFTNILFMYLAAKGIHNCLKNGHDTVFLVAFVGYLLVGSGSFLFHATLKCTSSGNSARRQKFHEPNPDTQQTPGSLSMSSR